MLRQLMSHGRASRAPPTGPQLSSLKPGHTSQAIRAQAGEKQQQRAQALHQQAESLRSQVTDLDTKNQQLMWRLEEAAQGTARLNEVIQGLEDRHQQLVAAKGLAEDESSRLRQLLDEALAADEGTTSQHILRAYERRLTAAHQHLVRQVRLTVHIPQEIILIQKPL